MNIKTLIALCLLLTGLLSSCAAIRKTSRKSKKTEKTYDFKVPEQYVFTEWLKFKSEFSIDNEGEKITLDAQFRIKQNEVIWVSVSKLGFPVAKLYLTPDSVFMLDNFHKKYLKGSYAELSDKLGSKLNFTLLQNIFLGQIIKLEGPGFSWFNGNELQLSSAPKDSIVVDSLSKESYLKPYSIQKIDTSAERLTAYFSSIPEHRENLSVLFVSRDSSMVYPIPNHVTITVFKNSILKMICNLVHDKIEILAELKTPFEIPDNYVKME